ncbi:MAG: hypothetical protein IME96_11230 [Proteobacteria bacterium]|nr:hypothetical protein [Pseudomonadota bacterium]
MLYPAFEASFLKEIFLEALKSEKGPLNDEHPENKLAMENDPEGPIVTWIVAQKNAHE